MPVLYLIVWSSFILSIKGSITVPDRKCSAPSNCMDYPWTTPNPTCVEGQCQCTNGTCLIYTRGTGRSASFYMFYCGKCGVLGSECNETIPCELFNCSTDNFCHCDRGNVYRELCYIYVPIATTVKSVVLIAVLVFLLIVLRVFKSRDRIKRYICRRCSDTESVQSTVVGFNPRSYQKSAAYTITNSDFMVTSDDSELEWAIEFSRRMSNRDEDWIPLEGSTWSSYASSRQSSISRSRFASRLVALASISEPGPSGLSRNPSESTSASMSTVSSRSSSSTRQRSSLRSSTSSALPPSTSSRSSSSSSSSAAHARRLTFSSFSSSSGSSSFGTPTTYSSSSQVSTSAQNDYSSTSGSYDAYASASSSARSSTLTTLSEN